MEIGNALSSTISVLAMLVNKDILDVLKFNIIIFSKARSGDQVRGRRIAGGGSAPPTSASSMYEPQQYDAYGQPIPQQPQLFDDTSTQNYGYGQQGTVFTLLSGL